MRWRSWSILQQHRDTWRMRIGWISSTERSWSRASENFEIKKKMGMSWREELTRKLRPSISPYFSKSHVAALECPRGSKNGLQLFFFFVSSFLQRRSSSVLAWVSGNQNVSVSMEQPRHLWDPPAQAGLRFYWLSPRPPRSLWMRIEEGEGERSQKREIRKSSNSLWKNIFLNGNKEIKKK